MKTQTKQKRTALWTEMALWRSIYNLEKPEEHKIKISLSFRCSLD